MEELVKFPLFNFRVTVPLPLIFLFAFLGYRDKHFIGQTVPPMCATSSLVDEKNRLPTAAGSLTNCGS